jgi:hypothetical protein
MRTATRRSLLSAALVSGLILGLVPAAAQVPSVNTGSVDVRNVLAGTANKEFKITINRNGAPAVNAVMMHIPASYTVLEGRSPGWQSQILTPRRVFFSAGTLAPASSQVFSIFANTPVPNQDLTSRWAAGVSTDGGTTFTEVDPSSSGAMDTTTRVLQVTSLAITAPEGARDTSVTGAQNNVTTVCQVQNVGSGVLNVDATLSGSRYQTTDPAATDIAPGATHAFTFGMTFDDVASNTSTNAECVGTAPGRATTGDRNVFGKRFDITIQPKAAFSYVATSLSPKMAAPAASPIFSVRVNKGGTQSPAVTLQPSGTDFRLSGGSCNPAVGPTALGAATTVAAGQQDNLLLQFAPLAIPLTTADGDCNVIVNVGGTDANDAAVSIRPLPNTIDTVRIDASIPVISSPFLEGAGSRCCNKPEAATHGDTLKFSGRVTDRNPATGQQEPCGSCTVVLAELRQYSTFPVQANSEVGQRIPVAVSNTSGALTASHLVGTFHEAAKAVQMHIVMQDEAGNKSDLGNPTGSNVMEVDLLLPTILDAATSPAPTSGGQDLQRQLRIRFTEAVDNFDRPADGACPAGDWRVDGNSVLNCSRDADFQAASLLVSSELPDDTPGFTLAYFPQTPLSFHDRVGLDINTGTTVSVLDRIPPKAPVIDSVAGKPAQSDGKFYTNFQSSRAFVLSGAKAVKASYTVQLWQENGLADGLQTEGANADSKIAQDVAQGPTVSLNVPTTALTSDGSQTGKEYTVYGRSLDTASPANATPADVVKAFRVIVDTKAPVISTAQAQVDRIHVEFNEIVTGTDAAMFWELLDVGGDSLNLARVEGSNNARDIVVDDARYQMARAASIQYLFFGTPTGRYQDRAGNEVADKTLPTTAAL